jgi:hypothetical protein
MKAQSMKKDWDRSNAHTGMLAEQGDDSAEHAVSARVDSESLSRAQ